MRLRRGEFSKEVGDVHFRRKQIVNINRQADAAHVALLNGCGRESSRLLLRSDFPAQPGTRGTSRTPNATLVGVRKRVSSLAIAIFDAEGGETEFPVMASNLDLPPGRAASDENGQRQSTFSIGGRKGWQLNSALPPCPHDEAHS